MSSIDFFALFSIGFFGGFGHCIGMCGGFVLSFNVSLASATPLQKTFGQLSYHYGRILTYSLIGAILGMFGALLHSQSEKWIFWQAVLQIFAGLIMFAIALEMSGFLHFKLSSPFLKFYQKFVSKLFQPQNRISLFPAGLLLGLIPCGFVYAILAKAATTHDPIHGFLTMLSFGVGTIPALLLCALFGQFLTVKRRKVLYMIAALLILIFAVKTLWQGVGAMNNYHKVLHHHHHE